MPSTHAKFLSLPHPMHLPIIVGSPALRGGGKLALMANLLDREVVLRLHVRQCCRGHGTAAAFGLCRVSQREVGAFRTVSARIGIDKPSRQGQQGCRMPLPPWSHGAACMAEIALAVHQCQGRAKLHLRSDPNEAVAMGGLAGVGCKWLCDGIMHLGRHRIGGHG